MKNIEEVKALLEKYYSGLTSLQEEKLLRKYFARNDVPICFQADMQLFQSDNDSLMNSDSILIEQEMLQTINRFDKSRKKQKSKNFKIYLAWAAAASIIVAIVTTWFVIQESTVSNQVVDTYTDPYIAMQETQRILILVGSKINVAQNEMKPLDRFKVPVELLQPMNELPKNLEHIINVKLIDKPLQIPILKYIFESESSTEIKCN